MRSEIEESNMNITRQLNDFVNQTQRKRSKPYYKIYKTLLTGDKPYSFTEQDVYWESEYLSYTIKNSVMAYSSNKDTAIALYKDFVDYLKKNGVSVPVIEFPPIPVANTFERLMFIAKYLQDKDNRICKLKDVLWVSERTIEEDLSRLRGIEDPIQVCGRKFFIPDTERRDSTLLFQSTAHPVFLAENLTQILVMLKGLKAMSENPLYKPYAMQTAVEVWDQLSPYAKKRIRFVLKDLMPEDYEWYSSLESISDSRNDEEEYHFHTEEACSRVYNNGPGVVLDCIKNGKSFYVEYERDGQVYYYRDCVMEKGSYDSSGIVVNCSGERVQLLFDHVLRSAYTAEELAAI